MALIKYRPRTPATRAVVKIDRSHLHKGGPHLPLTVAQSKTGARNHFCRITTPHIGGGSRQEYRLTDFKRDNESIYAYRLLKSGETRKVHVDCRATIGEVGNDEHNLRSYGKAGAKRWKGIRPTVRGLAMNPVDHPHGGGEGKSGQGNPHPVSPWGWNTKGLKTRHNKRTDNMIVQRRQNRIR